MKTLYLSEDVFTLKHGFTQAEIDLVLSGGKIKVDGCYLAVSKPQSEAESFKAQQRAERQAEYNAEQSLY